LDNPPMNAMSREMLALARSDLLEIEADDTVRAVVLTGRGRAFCSGADLKAAREGAGGEDLGGFGEVVQLLADLRVPVIAAINGPCIGGGLELALCCDLRIASTEARFVCAGVNMGLMASTYRLPRLIGVARAKAMLLTGLPHDAATAEAWGLVTAVHPAAELEAAALALAGRIASRAPLSVEASKRIADRAFDMAPDEAQAALAREVTLLRRSQDHREAVAAFLEKRQPVFARR
jgi:enoyl-CoA hydratase/carnithine racemase